MEWLRESARGLEGNPFVSRMLQNLMFADMQREIAKEDIESARGFQTSEREAGQKFRAGESEKAWERKKEEMKRTGWTLKPKSLPNGKEQMTWYKQSTREEIPQGDPYDPNILSKEALAQKRAGEGTGPFRGKSIQGQEMNILLSPNADTSAPLFHAAYAELGQPKIYTDPTTGQQRLITPDMRMYPKPTELNPNSTWNPLTMQTPVQEEPLQGKGYWEPMDYSQHGGIPGQERPVGTPTISAQEGPVGRTKEYNEFQAKSGGFYSRMLDANKTLDDLFAGPDRTTGTADDLTRKDVFSNREFILNAVPGIGNYLTSDNFQKGRQAMRNWVTANLRLESGAAIPPEELENEYIKWFPVFGDGAEVIKQKRESRKIVEENMRIQSQGAWESEFKPTWEERLKTREREGLGGGLSLDKPLGEGAFKMLPDGSIVRKERGAR